MKKKIKLYFIFSFLISFLTFFITNRFQAFTIGAQTSQPQEKTVEQAYKNIQVLKGMPESQLMPAMNFMRASLGVNCAYCHVNSGGDDKWEFEKDDKPTKLAARKHIQMTLDFNRANFSSQPVITCNTCHQGQTKPNAFPILPQKPPKGGAGGITSVAALPTVDQILDKYVQALGGRAAIEKLKTRVLKGSQTTWDGKEFPLEIYQTAPNKFLSQVTMPRGIISQGFNGTIGWVKNPRGQRELSGEDLIEIKRGAEFYDSLKLKELYPNLKIVGKEKIGEREAFVAESAVSPTKTVKLFFDAQTGLLARVATYTQTLIALIPEQMDFENYREVDGVKIPFMVRQSFVDPWSGWTRRFMEIKQNVPIDGAKFDLLTQK